MGGIFRQLLDVGVSLVEVPVAVAKDVVTLGGTITDTDKTYTVEKLEELADGLDDLFSSDD